MTEKLGAIVVGTGFGVLTHLRALRAAGFDVTALVGRDPDKTAARAASRSALGQVPGDGVPMRRARRAASG